MASAAERFLVWGGGGHGKVVADVIHELGHSVVGFVDANARPLGLSSPGYSGFPVIGEDELRSCQESAALPEAAQALALGIGDNTVRRRCYEALEGVRLPPLVHPSAVVSATATVGRGSVVLPGVIVNASARIGAGVILNTACVVEHDCDIGDGVHVSPGAILCGDVRVGAHAWIGAGAVVTPGVAVGANAIVGAGAVVLSAVEENCTVVGNPARLLIPRNLQNRGG